MFDLQALAVLEERSDRAAGFLDTVAEEFMAQIDQLFEAVDSPRHLTSSGLTEDVAAVLGKVNTVLTTVQNISTGLASMATTITSMDLSIADIASTVQDLPTEVAEEIMDAFFNQLGTLSRRTNDIGRSLEARFGYNIQKVRSGVYDNQLQARGIVSDNLAAWLQTMTGFSFPNVQTFGIGFADKLKEGFADIGGGLEGGLADVKDGLQRFGVDLQTAMNQLGSQLKDGATGGLNTLGNALMDVGVRFGNALKDASTTIASELRLALVEALATVSAPALGMLESFYDSRIAPKLPAVTETWLPAVSGICMALLGTIVGVYLFDSRMKQRLNIQYREWE